MASRLASLLRLSWRERLRLVEATVALAAVASGVRLGGYGRTRAALLRAGPNAGASPLQDREIDQAVSGLAWSVSAAAHHAPMRTTCLHRTLTLWWLLRRRGIESEVRVGATRMEDGIHAHAWLERGGVVLNDDVDVGERFAAFEGFR